MQEPVPTLSPRAVSRVVSTEELGSGPRYSSTYIKRTRTNHRSRPKLLFIRDSFATPIANLISGTTSETILMHHRGGEFDRDFISKHHPDVVIYEIAERGLGWELEPMSN